MISERCYTTWHAPQNRLPQREGYTKTTGFLIRTKVVLDLVISDMLRLIFAVILFVVIVGIGVGGLLYRTWFPKVETYIQSVANAIPDQSSTK